MIHQRIKAAKHWMRRQANRIANCIEAPRLILTWHRVCHDGFPDPDRLSVEPGRFAEQLAVLRRFMPVIPLAEVMTSRGLAAAITFDDGYADNLHHAAPALATAGLPATVFVTAGAIGSRREFWWDELAELLLGDDRLPPVFPEPGGAWSTGSPQGRRELFDHLASRCLALPPDEIAAQLAAVGTWAERTPIGRARRLPLDADGLRALARMPGITIGAHTVTHASLARLPPDLRNTELTSGKRLLEDLIGTPVDLLAYPYGTRDDVDPATIAAARRCGYRLAVTTDPGQVHRWSNPLRLRRHTVRDWTPDEFARRLRHFLVDADHGEDA